MNQSRKRTRAQVEQTAPLLKLPAELRKSIYEYVVQDTQSISIQEGRVLNSAPLSLVCRQIRDEYKNIHVTDGPRYASHVNIHITNFVHRSLSQGDAAEHINRLPRPKSGVWRTYAFRIFLTNVWDRYRYDLRGIIDGRALNIDPDSRYRDRNYDVEIRWEPKSFDVNFCREVLSKLDWVHSKAGLPTNWEKVKKAFEDVFQRYEMTTKTTTKKKRKRSNAKTTEDDSAPKSKRSKT